MTARMGYYLSLIFFIIFLFLLPVKLLQAESASPDRKAFLAALSDLQHGKENEFKLISNHLHNYCLYPYLAYADLAVHIPNEKPENLQLFLNDYSETPLAPHLLKLWLYQLAQNRDWKNFLKIYSENCENGNNKTLLKDINIECFQREALWQTGERDMALNNFSALLNKSHQVPKSCMSVLGQALVSSNIADQLLWERIEAAFQDNDPSMAMQFAAFLPDNQKESFRLLLSVYDNPLLILKPGLFQQAGVLQDRLLLIAIRKLAFKDPRLAATVFAQIQPKVNFTLDAQYKVIAVIAVMLAQNHDPSAANWLSAVRPEDASQLVREWRIRTALWNQDWNSVDKWVRDLPSNEKNTTQWRYWHARAMEQLGQAETAKDIYRDLSLHGDFYGQLASLRLNQLPLSGLKEMQVNASQVAALSNLPAMRRAHELYALHWLPESNQEWQWAISHLPEEDYIAAAALAVRWGWFEQAISTVNLINNTNNISLKFPMAYREEILRTSENNQVSPAVLFALIRQESLFTPYAHSHTGAVGLMQLMPGTANFLASKMHMGFRIENLLDPNINLMLGGVYFKKLMVTFHGQEVLAIAAYNAGPNRVKKWLPPKLVSTDIWIENIPYHETRNYVKNILTSASFYEKELGLPSRLSERVNKL